MLKFLQKLFGWLIVVGVVLATVNLLIFSVWKVIQAAVIDLLWLFLGSMIFGGIFTACWLINDRD